MDDCSRETNELRRRVHKNCFYVNQLLRHGRDDEVLTQRVLVSDRLAHLLHAKHDTLPRKLEFSFRCGALTASGVASAFGRADSCSMTLNASNVRDICAASDVPLTDVLPTLRHHVTLLLEFDVASPRDERPARPTGIACDRDGNLLVVDRDNKCVKVFDRGGRPLREFGRVGEGALQTPFGVALLSGERLAVSDSSEERLNIYSLDGRLLHSWNDIGTYPRGVATCPKTKQARAIYM